MVMSVLLFFQWCHSILYIHVNGYQYDGIASDVAVIVIVMSLWCHDDAIVVMSWWCHSDALIFLLCSCGKPRRSNRLVLHKSVKWRQTSQFLTYIMIINVIAQESNWPLITNFLHSFTLRSCLRFTVREIVVLVSQLHWAALWFAISIIALPHLMYCDILTYCNTSTYMYVVS